MGTGFVLLDLRNANKLKKTLSPISKYKSASLQALITSKSKYNTRKPEGTKKCNYETKYTHPLSKVP